MNIKKLEQKLNEKAEARTTISPSTSPWAASVRPLMSSKDTSYMIRVDARAIAWINVIHVLDFATGEDVPHRIEVCYCNWATSANHWTDQVTTRKFHPTDEMGIAEYIASLQDTRPPAGMTWAEVRKLRAKPKA